MSSFVFERSTYIYVSEYNPGALSMAEELQAAWRTKWGAQGTLEIVRNDGANAFSTRRGRSTRWDEEVQGDSADDNDDHPSVRSPGAVDALGDTTQEAAPAEYDALLALSQQGYVCWPRWSEARSGGPARAVVFQHTDCPPSRERSGIGRAPLSTFSTRRQRTSSQTASTRRLRSLSSLNPYVRSASRWSQGIRRATGGALVGASGQEAGEGDSESVVIARKPPQLCVSVHVSDDVNVDYEHLGGAAAARATEPHQSPSPHPSPHPNKTFPVLGSPGTVSLQVAPSEADDADDEGVPPLPCVAARIRRSASGRGRA